MASKGEVVSPLSLRRGDTIAFISPSSRLNEIFPTRVSRARSALEALGFHVKIFYNPIPAHASFQTAVQLRCSEIHAAFADTSVRAIICTVGGLSANELLPHLDYDLIKSNAKIFCGYSDITLLHHAFFTQAGLRTFYGPAAITQFAEYPEPHKFTINHFIHVLQDSYNVPVGPLPRSDQWTQEFLDWQKGLDTTRARSTEANHGWKWLRLGEGEGRLFGGCLPSVLQLTGTKFWPSYEGRILFLELPDSDLPDKGIPVEQAQSLIADLVNVGVIGMIKGLVVGRPFHYEDSTWERWETMLVEQCGGTDFPILSRVDIGHTDPMLTIPLDCMVRLNGEKDQFEILETAVKSG